MKAPSFRRTAVAAATIYSACLVFGYFALGTVSQAWALFSILPALIGSLLAGGYVRVMSTSEGFQLVDARRARADVEAANARARGQAPATSDEPTAYNVNGLVMPNGTGGLDVAGNLYGVTDNDPR